MDIKLLYSALKARKQAILHEADIKEKLNSIKNLTSNLAVKINEQNYSLSSAEGVLNAIRPLALETTAVNPSKLKSVYGIAVSDTNIRVDGSGFVYSVSSDLSGYNSNMNDISNFVIDGKTVFTHKFFFGASEIYSFFDESYGSFPTMFNSRTFNMSTNQTDYTEHQYLAVKPLRFDSYFSFDIAAENIYRVLYYLD